MSLSPHSPPAASGGGYAQFMTLVTEADVTRPDRAGSDDSMTLVTEADVTRPDRAGSDDSDDQHDAPHPEPSSSPATVTPAATHSFLPSAPPQSASALDARVTTSLAFMLHDASHGNPSFPSCGGEVTVASTAALQASYFPTEIRSLTPAPTVDVPVSRTRSNLPPPVPKFKPMPPSVPNFKPKSGWSVSKLELETGRHDRKKQKRASSKHTAEEARLISEDRQRQRGLVLQQGHRDSLSYNETPSNDDAPLCGKSVSDYNTTNQVIPLSLSRDYVPLLCSLSLHILVLSSPCNFP